jgi:hypothetical protein
MTTIAISRAKRPNYTQNFENYFYFEISLGSPSYMWEKDPAGKN